MKFNSDAKNLASQVTVEVTIKNYQQWGARVWIGTKLIQFAAWLMWVNVVFISEFEDEV